MIKALASLSLMFFLSSLCLGASVQEPEHPQDDGDALLMRRFYCSFTAYRRHDDGGWERNMALDDMFDARAENLDPLSGTVQFEIGGVMGIVSLDRFNEGRERLRMTVRRPDGRARDSSVDFQAPPSAAAVERNQVPPVLIPKIEMRWHHRKFVLNCMQVLERF